MSSTYSRNSESHRELGNIATVYFPSVLAVHEDPIVLSRWCRELERLQCRVLTASSSLMARAFLRAFPIDLVVCDSKVALGGEDYVDLTRRVPLLRAVDSSIIGYLIARTFAGESL